MSQGLKWMILEGMPHRELAQGRWLRVRTYQWGGHHESARLELLTEYGWDTLHDIHYATQDIPITPVFKKDVDAARRAAIQRCQVYANDLYDERR
jgi:hypothetical protein